MKKLFILSMLVFPVILSAQINKTVFDEVKEQEILIGECNPEGFRSEGFNSWFDAEYDAFQVNDEFFVPGYNIQFDSVYVFLGTWCSDSKREVPRFCKIMDHTYFAGTPVRYFALDGNKHTDVINTKEFYIDYVPTFIFYYRGNELCRIIEAPKLSLEEDIMDLLSRIQP